MMFFQVFLGLNTIDSYRRREPPRHYWINPLLPQSLFAAVGGPVRRRPQTPAAAFARKSMNARQNAESRSQPHIGSIVWGRYTYIICRPQTPAAARSMFGP